MTRAIVEEHRRPIWLGAIEYRREEHFQQGNRKSEAMPQLILRRSSGSR
jgi:hypothetical protein